MTILWATYILLVVHAVDAQWPMPRLSETLANIAALQRCDIEVQRRYTVSHPVIRKVLKLRNSKTVHVTVGWYAAYLLPKQVLATCQN